MGIPIDENKMVGRLNSHPIVIVPLWEGAPTSDSDEWTVDLCNYLLNDLGELANLIYLYIYSRNRNRFKHNRNGWLDHVYWPNSRHICIHFCI